jgi:hypothetical protein
MYINGQRVATQVEGEDHNLFLHTAGRVSVGGFGSSGSGMEQILPNHVGFQGAVDEVYVWSRSLTEIDIEGLIVR